MIRCYVVGRSAPSDGVEIAYDKIDGIELSTISRTYTETEACIPERILKRIAKHFKKKISDLTDEDVAEYLVEVMHIDEKVDGYDHIFEDKW